MFNLDVDYSGAKGVDWHYADNTCYFGVCKPSGNYRTYSTTSCICSHMLSLALPDVPDELDVGLGMVRIAQKDSRCARHLAPLTIAAHANANRTKITTCKLVPSKSCDY